MRKAGIKKLALELGGNGPLVVLDDADLDRAVDAAVFGSFFHSGQICMIANRVIVDASVHDEFVERFVDRVGSLKVGDPSDEGTDIGPVINREPARRHPGQARPRPRRGRRAACSAATRPARPAWPCPRTSCWPATTRPRPARRSSAR